MHILYSHAIYIFHAKYIFPGFKFLNPYPDMIKENEFNEQFKI